MVTGRRHTGRPLGPPVKAFPYPVARVDDPLSFVCVILAYYGPPAASSGSPPRLRGAERTSKCLRRPPHELDRPLRPCPSETLRLVITSPMGRSE